MKFSVDARILDDALSALAVAVPKSAPMPIVKNILIELEELDVDLPWEDDEKRGVAVFSATDLHVSARVTLPVVLDEPGRILVDGNKFVGLVGLMNGKVTFQLKDNKVKLRSKGKSATLSTADPEQFPPVLEYGGTFARLPCEQFIESVTHVGACANDGEASNFAGMQLVVDGNELNLYATDGNIVGHAIVPIEGPALPVTALAYASPFVGLVKGLKGAEYVDIGMQDDSPHLRLQAEADMIKSEFAILTLEGNYPNVPSLLSIVFDEQVSNSQYSTIITVENKAVTDALKPIRLFDDKRIKLKPYLDEESQEWLQLVLMYDQDGYDATVEAEFIQADQKKSVIVHQNYLNTALNGLPMGFSLATVSVDGREFVAAYSDSIRFVVMGFVV